MFSWYFSCGRMCEYVRRPAIAQRRITNILKLTVNFWYNDKRLHHRSYVELKLPPPSRFTIALAVLALVGATVQFSPSVPLLVMGEPRKRPLFNPLHGDPRFAALVAHAKERAAARKAN